LRNAPSAEHLGEYCIGVFYQRLVEMTAKRREGRFADRFWLYAGCGTEPYKSRQRSFRPPVI
jgi:hypothetical protein